MWRVSGPVLGSLVMAVDVAKGLAAVALAGRVASSDADSVTAGVAAVAGHMFPVWLRGRGGKGVATACGVFALLAPLATLCAVATFLVTTATTRLVSVGLGRGDGHAARGGCGAGRLTRRGDGQPGGGRAHRLAAPTEPAAPVARHRAPLRTARWRRRACVVSRCWARAVGARPWRFIWRASGITCACGRAIARSRPRWSSGGPMPSTCPTFRSRQRSRPVPACPTPCWTRSSCSWRCPRTACGTCSARRSRTSIRRRSC